MKGTIEKQATKYRQGNREAYSFTMSFEEINTHLPSITTTLPPFGHIWSVFSRKSLRGRQDHKAVKRVGRSP